MLPSPVTFGGERAAPRRRAPARKEAPVSAGPRLLPEAEERQCRTESNRTEPNRAEPSRAEPCGSRGRCSRGGSRPPAGTWGGPGGGAAAGRGWRWPVGNVRAGARELRRGSESFRVPSRYAPSIPAPCSAPGEANHLRRSRSPGGREHRPRCDPNVPFWSHSK